MSKINKVIRDWKAGDVHSLKWFARYGVDQRLAYKYYENGYLERVASGVFYRAGDKIDPLAVVRFLQEEINLKLHVSGKSALEFHGHGHYLELAEKRLIDLISYSSKNFPKWLRQYSSSFELRFKKSSLLKNEDFLQNYETKNGFVIKISCRELAIIELIDTLNLSSSLETVENYMESLTTLRPKVMQEVLEKCHSIKAKRVFLYLAQKLNLVFFKKLDLSKINLGSGKRVIVKDGEFNSAYGITVNREKEENPF